MAVAYVASRGSAQNKTAEAGTAITVASVTLGSRLIVLCGYDDNGVISSVTDNQSNTYVEDAAKVAFSGAAASIWSAKITSGSAPTSVTVNWSTQPAAKALRVFEFSGTADSGYAGTPGTASGAGGGTDVGPTSLTVDPGEAGAGLIVAEAPATVFIGSGPDWATGQVDVATSGGGSASNIANRSIASTDGQDGSAKADLGSADWVAISLVYRPLVERVPRFTSYPQILAH